MDDSARGCEKVPVIFILNTFAYVGNDVFLICLMAVSEGELSIFLNFFVLCVVLFFSPTMLLSRRQTAMWITIN